MKEHIGVWLSVLGFVGAASLLVPREARAHSGSFFETIGTSIAVGTVLGASTLPFYDQPGKHVANLAYGAAAGATVGLGVLVYGLFRGDSAEEASLARPGERVTAAQKKNPVRPEGQAVSSAITVHHAAVWTPLVSLTW